MQGISEINELLEPHQYYESETALLTLDNWYKVYKEDVFFKHIFDKTPLKGVILEVGGGTGFQGKVISNFVDGLYLHSDYSFSLCRSAKKKGLLSVRMDGLKLALPDQSVDSLITIEISTIRRSESLRYMQLNEFYRVIKKSGYLWLVSNILNPTKGFHCINNKDIVYLERMGFKRIKVIYWGIIPGHFWKAWNTSFFGFIEKLLSRLSFGIRKIVILQRS